MLSGIQVITLAFCCTISYLTFLNFKRREFTLRELLGWEAMWIAFAGVTLFPSEFEVFATKLGTVRPLDLFSVLGFVVVLSISFYTFTNLDRLRKRFEKAIRDLALADLPEESLNGKRRKK